MDSTSASSKPSRISTAKVAIPVRQSGLWLTATRVLWVFVVLTTLALFVSTVPVFYREQSALSPQSYPEGWSRDELQAVLTELDFSATALAEFLIVRDAISFLIFTAVGVLIFWKKSDEWIGWFSSLLLVLFGWINSYSVSLWALSQPAGEVAYDLVNNLVWTGFFIFLYIFPNGRFVPRWTRIPAIVQLAWVLAIPFLALPAWDEGIGLILTLAIFGAGVYGQVHRYRRLSDPAQRQQTKWLVFAVVIFFVSSLLVLVAIPTFFPSLNQIGIQGFLNALVGEYVILSLILLLVPLAVAISILRYRLWDIDVVVNRALIYGILTTILAAVFAGSLTLIDQITEDIFGEDSTALTATVSTILVASIFQPLRERVETWINKRFYPEKLGLTKEFFEFKPHIVGLIGTTDLLQVIVRRASDLMQSKFGAIFLDRGDGEFDVVETFMIKKTDVPPYSPTKKERDQLRKAKVLTYLDGYPFDIVVPIYVPRMKVNQLIGLLGLGPREKGRGYSADNLKTLTKIGGEAGKSIYATQLNERMRRNILEVDT